MGRPVINLEASTYKPLSPKAVKELIGPHTWIASIGPVLIGGALCVTGGALPINAFNGRALIIWALMLVTAVMMQCAVNTYNDYRDFLSGLDTAENITDTTDASIVYNHLNPRDALKVVIVTLVIAGCSGMAIVLMSSWVTLALGAVGMATVLLYSGGPKPIASLPLGEFVSGFVMGVIIPVATYYAVTGTLSWLVLAASFPSFACIALIMQTNNTCDIERDIEVGRRTMPVVVGRKASMRVMIVAAVAVFLWMLVLLYVSGLVFGIFVVAIAALLSIPLLRRIAKGPCDLANRRVMMQTATKLNKIVMVAWALAILFGVVMHG